MSSSVSQESDALLLDFKCHCLMCLQHEDPAVLQQIANENPRGLDFQSVLYHLTGDPFELGEDNDEGNTQTKFYPVLKNLPPLCKLCYDIVAELYLFHIELMELQRKLRSQTVAARQIVKGTTRKRGGMRKEFFNRLKSCAPERETKAVECFIENFHGLILEADKKAVFPEYTSLTLDNSMRGSSPSSSSEQSQSSSLQTYDVEFVGPVVPRASQIIPLQLARPQRVEIVSNGRIDLNSPLSSPSNNHVFLVENESNNNRVAYAIGGTEKEEMIRLYEKLDQQKEGDVGILENGGNPGNQPVVSEEEDYGSDRSNELDLEYLNSMLPSSIILEQVDEHGQRVEQNSPGFNEMDGHHDDDVEEMDQRMYPSTPQLLSQVPIILFCRAEMTPPTPTSTTSSEEPLAEVRPKPFMCGYKECRKRFKTYRLRDQHETVHTDERPFVCDICGNTFRQKNNLYRHKKTHDRQ